MNKTLHVLLLTTSLGLPSWLSAQTNLSVPLRVQEHSQWCWAGVSQMILNYKGKSVTQCAIANYAWNISYACGNTTFDWNSPANRPNYATEITRILNYWGTPATTLSTYLSQTSVQNAINAQKPFVILWTWTAGGGHFVVGKGYSGNYLYINDPWPGNGAYTRTYASTVRASDRNWTYTNRLQ